MLFNSLAFVIFFVVVVIAYYLLPSRIKWIWLLLAGFFFYMYSNQTSVFVPILIILFTYTAGLLMSRATKPGIIKKIFITALIFNIGVLFYYKYTNFFSDTIVGIYNYLNLNLLGGTTSISNPILVNVLTPLGISYITFQAIGYLIEIKRGNYSAERHLGHFSTYIMFFPKMLSGPVERAHNFLPQLKSLQDINYSEITLGLKLIAWGLFKKVIIADRLGIFVNNVFNDVHEYQGITLILCCIFSAIQLYADFSGYTDMALGIARLLGFKLMPNFNLPFFALSISEFWRKWHMSLSTWFADYFYNPIAIRRRDWGKWSIMYASILTFVVLGLWHGANWTYVIFGGLHGLMLSLEFFSKKFRKNIRLRIPENLNAIGGILFTFLFFSFTLIYFRADSVSNANYFVANMFNLSYLFDFQLLKNSLDIGLNMSDYMIILVAVILMQYVEYKNIIQKISSYSKTLRWSIYIIFLFFVFLFAQYGSSQFIYFQF